MQPVLLALATAMLLWIATRHVLEDLSRRPNQNRIVRLGVGTEKLEGNKSGATSNLPLALRVRCTRRVCCPDDDRQSHRHAHRHHRQTAPNDTKTHTQTQTGRHTHKDTQLYRHTQRQHSTAQTDRHTEAQKHRPTHRHTDTNTQ